MGGKYFFRQLDELALNLCVATRITNAEWQEYLTGALQVSRALGVSPKASIVEFRYTFPDAAQRKMSRDLVDEHGSPLERVAVMSPSKLVRGGMVALNWILPTARLQGFNTVSSMAALQWLREVARFNVEQAESIWQEAQAHYSR